METNIKRTQLWTNAAVFTCTLEWRKKTITVFVPLDGSCVWPHLGHGTLLLCVLKVSCPAVMGIGRQTGTNWHEWPWRWALCAWRRGVWLLGMCPCRWIMCSTFSEDKNVTQAAALVEQHADTHRSSKASAALHPPPPPRLDRTQAHTLYTPQLYRTQPSSKQTNSTTAHTHTHNTHATGVCMLPSSVFSWGQELHAEHDNKLWIKKTQTHACPFTLDDEKIYNHADCCRTPWGENGSGQLGNFYRMKPVNKLG